VSKHIPAPRDSPLIIHRRVELTSAFPGLLYRVRQLDPCTHCTRRGRGLPHGVLRDARRVLREREPGRGLPVLGVGRAARAAVPADGGGQLHAARAVQDPADVWAGDRSAEGDQCGAGAEYAVDDPYCEFVSRFGFWVWMVTVLMLAVDCNLSGRRVLIAVPSGRI
jgi:hypothetical protein